jgi:hypothetical protein
MINVPMVPIVQAVQSPSFFLPRDAGEETDGGLNDLNFLNDLNDWGVRVK